MSDQNKPSTGSQCYRPLQIVLIGTSLGDESDQAVRGGLAVARAAGARVYLVHSTGIEPSLVGLEAGFRPDLVQEQIAWAEDKLRQQIERLGIQGSELAGSAVLSGAPYRALTEAAQTARADLVVVGATESGPFAAELLGSTADRVLRKATCPVLVVRGELPVPPRRVLAPVDLSATSANAFRCGLGLLSQIARSGDVEVRSVYALSFMDALALQRQQKPDLPEISFEPVERAEAEKLRRFVAENAVATPFAVETAVLPGEARFEILKDLSEHPADLVMLGTHGRGGLDRLVLGSVASTVARKAPCSVLLISPDAAFAEGISEAVATQTPP